LTCYSKQQAVFLKCSKFECDDAKVAVDFSGTFISMSF